MKLHFELNIKPKPYKRPRFTSRGKSRFAYTEPVYRAYKRDLEALLRSENIEPYSKEIPLKLDIVFYMPKGKTVKREKPTVKPDLDNLVKAIKDAGNGILWHDDCQVVELNAKKIYEIDKPKIEITLSGLLTM